MSRIESISGSVSDATSLLRQLARQRESEDNRLTSDSKTTNESRRAEFMAQIKEAALAAGLDPAAADGLQDEIDAAITEATQSGGYTGDGGDAVRSAIDGVLQKHGVDLEAFRNALQSLSSGSRPPGPPSDAQRADFDAKFKEAALAAGLDPDDADSLQSEIKSVISEVLRSQDGTTDPRQAIQDAIDGLLKEHGVDIDVFKSRLAAAVGGSQDTVPLLDERA